MENEKDQNSHPEGDNQVARSDEHDREEEQRAKHYVLEECLLCRSDGFRTFQDSSTVRCAKKAGGKVRGSG